MLGVMQRTAVARGLGTAHDNDQDDYDPLTLIYQRGQPLVDIADIQYHLDLLGVFYKLHHAVDAAGIVVDPSTKVPIMSAAQRLFLSRAQHRFDLWTTNILDRPGYKAEALRPEEIPPVDVLLLLHVYMLNPIAYREDLIRVYPCLERVGPFPWKNIHPLINASTFEMLGTPAQIRLWESATAEPFEPRITTSDTDTVDITCPRCLSCNKVFWKTNEGTGFGEIGFSHVCPQCGLAINSDTLCVSKFLRELSSGTSLAHTALDKDGKEDTESAREISDDIRESLGGAAAINGDRFGWKLSNIEQALVGDVSENDSFHKWLTYVLSAYTHFGKASIDLKFAVLRQGRFIQSMHDILWAGPGSSFPGKEEALRSAVASYERYFALTKTHIHGLVPTLDVDLAFHTHQLSGPIYANDCFSILGRFLNHDDTESNPETYHENVVQSIEVWNRVYGDNLPPKYTPFDGSRPGECSNCSGTQPTRPSPLTKPEPDSTSNADLQGINLCAHGGGSDNIYGRCLPPLYRAHGPGGGPGGPPHVECSNCHAKPPPEKPVKPDNSGLSDESSHPPDETKGMRRGSESPHERGLPLYQPRGPGGGGPGGPPHVECSNCSAKPPPEKPPKPHSSDVSARGTQDNKHRGGKSPYEIGLPPLYELRGPGGGGGPGGPPHVECTNCSAKPPPGKPTKPHSSDASTHASFVDANPYSQGLPPLYRPRGPGGGGGPHSECSNCSAIDPKPKPKPKPGRDLAIN